MGCKSDCLSTTSTQKGRRLMISQGDGQYKKGEVHIQCEDCLKEQLADGKLLALFNNDQKLIEKYKKIGGL